MLAITRRRAFRELARSDARDLVRDPLTGASMLTFALILLVIHTLMWLAFSVAGESPRVAPRALTAAPTTEIAEALAPFTAGGEAPNTRLDFAGDRVTLAMPDSRVGWDALWQALRAAGVPADAIEVLGRDGEPAPDFLRLNLATALLSATAAIALIGTTVPLVAARERGMLRLLGTTPLPRWLFLASRLPARLALLAVCAVGVTAIGLARRYTEVTALPRLAVTVLCAAVMLFGVAALCAARARNAEASQQLMSGITLALVFSAGAVLPAFMLPAPVRVATGLLPGGWVAEAASADLAAIPPLLPVPAYWALMLATGTICFVLAARCFLWDAAPTRNTQPQASVSGVTPQAPSPEGVIA